MIFKTYYETYSINFKDSPNYKWWKKAEEQGKPHLMGKKILFYPFSEFGGMMVHKDYGCWTKEEALDIILKNKHREAYKGSNKFWIEVHIVQPYEENYIVDKIEVILDDDSDKILKTNLKTNLQTQKV